MTVAQSSLILALAFGALAALAWLMRTMERRK